MKEKFDYRFPPRISRFNQRNKQISVQLPHDLVEELKSHMGDYRNFSRFLTYTLEYLLDNAHFSNPEETRHYDDLMEKISNGDILGPRSKDQLSCFKHEYAFNWNKMSMDERLRAKTYIDAYEMAIYYSEPESGEGS